MEADEHGYVQTVNCRLVKNYKDAWDSANESYNLQLEIYGESSVQVAESLNSIAIDLIRPRKMGSVKNINDSYIFPEYELWYYYE